MISCSDDGPDYVDELDVVYTNYDSSFDFSTTTTYALPDRVIEVTGENIGDTDFDEDVDYVDPVYGDPILAGIKENMDAFGWQEVDESSNPDVIILPTAMDTVNLYYYYDWGYWGWYYPGWGPGWGWYYPGYYPPIISGYRSGTILLQMTYPSGIGVNDNIPVLWTGAINGLLEGSTSSIQTRIENTVDQVFKQSQYLNK
ncbi:DUF4136 domain-containing protein [Joostella atrarenae]|uniref:DUF4136 domain-containing protein n=2 Tax=Joostella TaxID=453850 RepID=A0ABS9J6F3_9FLAO|nr:DUF4136 domain-containing protein [Joostella atrarenae]MCF8715970.1 DUF4136 domain-containing protein [Joostella atrarenae]